MLIKNRQHHKASGPAILTQVHRRPKLITHTTQGRKRRSRFVPAGCKRVHGNSQLSMMGQQKNMEGWSTFV